MGRNESWQDINVPNSPMNDGEKELFIPKSVRTSKLRGLQE